jgi:hypothetical protein
MTRTGVRVRGRADIGTWSRASVRVNSDAVVRATVGASIGARWIVVRSALELSLLWRSPTANAAHGDGLGTSTRQGELQEFRECPELNTTRLSHRHVLVVGDVELSKRMGWNTSELDGVKISKREIWASSGVAHHAGDVLTLGQ